MLPKLKTNECFDLDLSIFSLSKPQTQTPDFTDYCQNHCATLTNCEVFKLTVSLRIITVNSSQLSFKF